MLDLRRLQLLHELARRRTIAAVAEALHLSPSAVSQQLRVLESEAGTRLLDRVGRGVRLTDAGRRLSAVADAVLTQIERAEADLAALADTPAGTVRIASFQTATLALLPHALRLLAAHDQLRVELAQVEPERALPALLAHDFDLVVAEEYPGVPGPIHPGLHRDDLCRDPLRLAMPPGQPIRTRPEQFADHPWVMEPAGGGSRRWATALCRAAGFEPDVRYESDDLLVHAALVSHGRAAAFLPDLVWSGRRPDVPVHPLPGQERVLFTAVRTGTATHPTIRAVRDALRDASRSVRAPA